MWDFTEEDFISTVIDLVVKNPDFVYQKPEGMGGCCYLQVDDKPGCLFGQALLKLGVSKNFLYDCDPYSDGDNPDIRQMLAANTNFSDKTVDLCSSLQDNQDCGISWKKSLVNALLED